MVRTEIVIMEGKKQRVQRFQGTVIKIKGSLSRKTFTVRKIIDGVGVEKSFLLHSPLVPKVEVLKRAKVRRAKLYYLRDRVGAKANRLKVKDDSKEVKESNSSNDETKSNTVAKSEDVSPVKEVTKEAPKEVSAKEEKVAKDANS